MFIFYIFVICLVGISNICAADDAKGADARSTDVHVGCFSGDSSVMLTNGEQKQISDLQTGDQMLAIDQLKIIPSEMFIMLHKETLKQGSDSIFEFFILLKYTF